MAKSNAERQAAYRARHLKDVEGKGGRLNLVIDIHAKLALERLARCYGVTQKQMLEKLAVEAERATLEKIEALPSGQVDYYDGRLRLDADSVTA